MGKDYGNRYIIGIPRLEIFSVSINKNDDDGNRRSELYGTIQVVDGRGTKALLYDRGPQHSEAITQSKILTLTGSPDRCISALTSFTIDVDLQDKYGNLEISKGKIIWGKQNNRYYDKCLSICVPGINGSAMVHCAVFSAVQAVLEIILVETDNQQAGSSVFLSDAHVYGTVVAYYGKKFDYSTSDQRKYFKITLFNRQANDSVKLGPKNSIELTKSVVALPAYSSLVIDTNLFVRGSNVGDSDVRCVQGKTAEIPPVNVMECDIQGQGLTARVIMERRGSPCREEHFK